MKAKTQASVKKSPTKGLNDQLDSKKTAFGFFSVTVLLALAGALAAFYSSEATIEDVGEQIAVKILEILPKKNNNNNNDVVHNETEMEVEEEPLILSKASSFDPVGHYNAKQAMQTRYDKLRQACYKYRDFLRPERVALQTEIPQFKDLFLNVRSSMLFCPIEKIASKSFKTLFFRTRKGGKEEESKINYMSNRYPNHNDDVTMAIMVRHPMERLVSAYRYTFEKSYNAATGQEEGGEVSFPDFVDMLINGPIDFAEFLEENNIPGESTGIDTGMLDGKGISSAWNPYWRQCGVCHPKIMPHYIMHMNHFNEDAKVLIELLGNPVEGHDWLSVGHEIKSGLREVEEHYFSQVTKEDIRQIYDKYMLDHELFGFSPDYYIALAKDE